MGTYCAISYHILSAGRPSKSQGSLNTTPRALVLRSGTPSRSQSEHKSNTEVQPISTKSKSSTREALTSNPPQPCHPSSRSSSWAKTSQTPTSTNITSATAQHHSPRSLRSISQTTRRKQWILIPQVLPCRQEYRPARYRQLTSRKRDVLPAETRSQGVRSVWSSTLGR